MLCWLSDDFFCWTPACPGIAVIVPSLLPQQFRPRAIHDKIHEFITTSKFLSSPLSLSSLSLTSACSKGGKRNSRSRSYNRRNLLCTTEIEFMLSDDIWFYVFEFLDIEQFRFIAPVNHQFYRVYKNVILNYNTIHKINEFNKSRTTLEKSKTPRIRSRYHKYHHPVHHRTGMTPVVVSVSNVVTTAATTTTTTTTFPHNQATRRQQQRQLRLRQQQQQQQRNNIRRRRKNNNEAVTTTSSSSSDGGSGSSSNDNNDHDHDQDQTLLQEEEVEVEELPLPLPPPPKHNYSTIYQITSMSTVVESISRCEIYLNEDTSEDMPFLLLRIARSAALAGRLDILRYAIRKHPVPNPTIILRREIGIVSNALRNGRLNIIEYARRMGFKFQKFDEACDIAARFGHLHVLKRLREIGCPWDEWTMVNAARGGHLEVLKWLHSQGCPWDEKVCAGPALGGHLHIIEWLRIQGCPWSEGTTAGAAFGGHLTILKWLKAQNCPWDAKACSCAAAGGHLEILIWLRENNCPWTSRTCRQARNMGHYDILEWAINNGCPIDQVQAQLQQQQQQQQQLLHHH